MLLRNESVLTPLAEFKVGIPVSLSGQFRVQGRQALAGLQAWAEGVNRSGGLFIGELNASVPVVSIRVAGRQLPGKGSEWWYSV